MWWSPIPKMIYRMFFQCFFMFTPMEQLIEYLGCQGLGPGTATTPSQPPRPWEPWMRSWSKASITWAPSSSVASTLAMDESWWIMEDGFGTARPVVPFPLSRCRVPVVPLSRSRCPVVPLAVPVGSQRAAAWRTFAFRRHFGKNEVRSPKTVVKLRFARVRRNPFARNEVWSSKTGVKWYFCV